MAMRPVAFELHPQLAADSVDIGRLPLCRLLLMNDRNYPWCILVPMRNGVREIHELDEKDSEQLLREVRLVSRTMQAEFSANKMNVAALGNVVPQLHVHIIARFEVDPVWPAPVWGQLPPSPYPSFALDEQVAQLQEAFASRPEFRTDL